jgi:hypothetical protein
VSALRRGGARGLLAVGDLARGVSFRGNDAETGAYLGLPVLVIVDRLAAGHELGGILVYRLTPGPGGCPGS